MSRWLLHDLPDEDDGSGGHHQYQPTAEEVEEGCKRWLAQNPGRLAWDCPCEEAIRSGNQQVVGCFNIDPQQETNEEKREIRMGALICIFVLIAFAVLLRVCLAPRARRERREREEREARERIEAAAAKEREIRRSWRTGMFAVQPDGEHIVVMVMHPEDESMGDFGPALVDEKALEAAARAEGPGVVVVSRASSPAPPTHRRRYSRGHGYEFDASMGVVVGGGGGDAAAEGGRVDATPPPPPTPAGEREDGTGEVTADVVVAVNVPDGRS